MDDGELWRVLVTAVAAPLLLYWLTDGIVSRVKARRARAAELDDNEREAEREHVRNLEAALERESARADREAERAERAVRARRALEDYALRVRDDWIGAGCKGPPPPWPDRLT